MLTSSPHAHDVEALAEQAAHGDTDALGLLFERHHDALLRYLRVLTRNNVALADDVDGATWVKVATSIHRYARKGGGFEAWLFQIARNELRNHRRFTFRHPERLDGHMLAHDQADFSNCPDALLARRMEQHDIAAAVNGLPAPQRRCVILRFVVGLTQAQTGHVMAKSEEAVKQLQWRALRRLRKSLAGIADRSRGMDETVGSLTLDDLGDDAGGLTTGDTA